MQIAGFVTPDPKLMDQLLALVQTFRKPPTDPTRLAERLASEEWYFVQIKAHALAEPPPAEYRDKVERFVKAIEDARSAWLDLPPTVQEVMHQNIPYTNESQFSKSILESLQQAYFFKWESRLPDWRTQGIERLQQWGADLEMLDLLQSLGRNWQANHLPDKGARRRPELGFVRAIADICEEHGIKKSTAEQSQLSKVVRIMLRDSKADLRELIQSALRLGG